MCAGVCGAAAVASAWQSVAANACLQPHAAAADNPVACRESRAHRICTAAAAACTRACTSSQPRRCAAPEAARAGAWLVRRVLQAAQRPSVVQPHQQEGRQLAGRYESRRRLCGFPAGARERGAVAKQVLAVVEVQHRVGHGGAVGTAVAWAATTPERQQREGKSSRGSCVAVARGRRRHSIEAQRRRHASAPGGSHTRRQRSARQETTSSTPPASSVRLSSCQRGASSAASYSSCWLLLAGAAAASCAGCARSRRQHAGCEAVRS